MSEYGFMQETVDKICWSMLNEPDMWVIDVYDVYHVLWGIRHYKSDFTKIWERPTFTPVFSKRQAAQIESAYHKLTERKASAMQQQIINSMQPSPKIYTRCIENKPWWKFWK